MTTHKIIITGGGFGGVFCARELGKLIKRHRLTDVSIELISQRNYLVFHPLLPEVASGTINAQDAVTPLRNLLPGLKIRLAEVTGIDFNRKQVQIMQGQRRLVQEVAFDELVLCSGQVTNLSLFPGFDQHSSAMKDIDDAYGLRNHVIGCLEMADITKFPDIKKRALTFVVAGGGFSGVETMGELVEMIRRTLKFYPNIDPGEIRAILIQRGDCLLPEMSPKLGAYALSALQKRGVEVQLEVGIVSASENCVTTDSGEAIDTMTIVTTIGNGPSPFVEGLGLELQRGKVEVNRFLQCDQHPNLWSLGDTALVPMNDEPEARVYAPPTAQYTVKEAVAVARNIVAAYRGQPLQPFEYKPKGMLASLGNYQGVAEIYGIKVTGLLAWLTWRALYIGMLPGFATRLRVALNWLFDYFLPRTIVHISSSPQQGTHYNHYRQGDQILNVDQVVDGLYILVSGELRATVPDSGEGGVFDRTILPGDHIGEQLLTRRSLSTYTLTATENSVVLVLNGTDFLRLRKSFTGLDNYFNNLDSARYPPHFRELGSSGRKESGTNHVNL